MLLSEGGGQAELQGTHWEEGFPFSENATETNSTEGTSTAKKNLLAFCFVLMLVKNKIRAERIRDRDHWAGTRRKR